jgi:hypothetical protein
MQRKPLLALLRSGFCFTRLSELKDRQEVDTIDRLKL